VWMLVVDVALKRRWATPNLKEQTTQLCPSDFSEETRGAVTYDFDSIHLDVLMPRIAGIDFARQVRAADAQTRLPAFTTRMSGATWSGGVDAGDDGHLYEPFLLTPLLALLCGIPVARYSLPSPVCKFRIYAARPASRETKRAGSRPHTDGQNTGCSNS
jgi:DNA-binding response OmpR family regulator